MLECVINISEGTHLEILEVIAKAAMPDLLDVHTDVDHNRSVLTVVGEQAARAVAAAGVVTLDIRSHSGAHPRFGVVDVVPFVPLGRSTMADAVEARDAFAAWASDRLGVPCFTYGPERSLPEVRRGAFIDLVPDSGPHEPHPTAGAIAVGARPLLVAYNLWLEQPDLDCARRIARSLRGPAVRALALQVGGHVQVSLNLIEPLDVGPADVYDAVAHEARIERAELVGLIPSGVLDRTDPSRWEQLDLGPTRTIEARLSAIGLNPDL